MNYTKGEWKVHRDGVGNLQVFTEHRRGTGKDYATGSVIAKILTNSKADAFLIAAVPKLYRAGKRFFNPDGTYNLHPANFQLLAEALAQADDIVATTKEAK